MIDLSGDFAGSDEFRDFRASHFSQGEFCVVRNCMRHGICGVVFVGGDCVCVL